MAEQFRPKHVIEKDGYVFASPDMRGLRNKHGKPWTVRTIFLYNVAQVLYKHNKRHATRDKPVSERTKSRRFIECRAMAHDLHDLGYRITLPTQIKQKHVKALTHYWESRQDLKESSVLQKVSVLRVFLGWMGKEGVMGFMTPAEMFANPDKMKRSLVATEDKSWANKADPVELIEQVIEDDWRVGFQLKLSQLFGMRPKETWCFKPRIDYDPEQAVLKLTRGTKGGRPRVVPVMTDEQKRFLDEMSDAVYSNTDSLIPRRMELNAWKCHYYRVTKRHGICRENGIVPHGLRHGFAHQQYEKFAGHPAAVKEPQKPKDADHIQTRIARLLVSEQLGHSRESITAAYTGNHE